MRRFGGLHLPLDARKGSGDAGTNAVTPTVFRPRHAARCDGGRGALWQALGARQLEGFKFKRQVPLKGYIVDLVCFEAKLIVEVDGGQHAEWASNAVRDAAFVLR